MRSGVAAIGGAEAHGEGEQVSRIESRTHPAELPHGFQHQAGADQQDQRRRYLRDHQHGAKPVLTARGAAAAFLKRGVQIEAGQPAEPARGRRSRPWPLIAAKVKASTQPSTPISSMRGSPPGMAATTACVPQRARSNPKAPPARASSTLSVRQLPDHAALARAHGGANGHLSAARRGAGQQQIGDVGAGDQEHKADRAQQHQESGPHVPHDFLRQRPHVDAVLGIRLGIGLRELRGHAVHVGLRLLSGHPGLQASHGAQTGMRLARARQHVVPLAEQGVDVRRAP